MKKIINRDEHGAAMSELLVAISVILVVLTASALVMVNSLRTQTENEDRDRAVQMVRDEIEKARALSFDELYLNAAVLQEVGNNKYAYNFDSGSYDAATKSFGQSVYQNNPLVNPVMKNGEGIGAPWSTKTLGTDGAGEGGVTYYIRRDVTYYSDAPQEGSEYRSKEVTITAYWGQGDNVDSATMSWIRTPSLSEIQPAGAIVSDNITLNHPTDITYTYDALGRNMDVYWYFEQDEVSENDLTFEIYMGTPSNMKKVRTVAGVSRMAGGLEVQGATHLYIRALYRGETADSEMVSLVAPEVVTVPDAPTITGNQVPGTTTARFSFAPVSQARTYIARYRVDDQPWVTLGNMNPNTNWTSDQMPGGGKVQFSVYAANAAGASEIASTTVNVLGIPDTPELADPSQRLTDVTFRFASAARADSYRAQYKLNDGNWQNLSNPRANSDISVSGGDVGNVVHFRVAGFSNVSGIGNYAEISYEMIPPPSEPEIYVAEQQPGHAVFGFAIAPNADSYEAAYRIGNGSWVVVASPKPGENIEIPWNASSDQTVHFRVRSNNEISGYSDYSTASVDMKVPPAAPPVSSAVQRGTEARFVFDAVSRAQSYVAEYRVGEQGDWVPVENPTPGQTIAVEATGAHSEVITLRVKALNEVTGDSEFGTRDITMIGRPPAPEITKSEQVDRDAVFSFAPVEIADDYRVEYQVGENGEWKQYSNVAPNTDISIRGTGAQEEVVTIRVWAINIAGESENYATGSVTLVVPPLPPEIVGAEQQRMNAVFSFERSAGAESYVVQYRIANGSWVSVPAEDYTPELPEPDEDGYVEIPDVPFKVTVPAQSGQKVDLRVKAVNVSGESEFATASLTMISPPGAPNITKSVQDKDQAIFAFAPVTSAASYEVAYRVDGGSWTSVNLAPRAELKVDANVGQKVEFRVRALNIAGESPYAESSVTMIAAPDAPRITKSAQEGNKAVFIFAESERASSYVAQYRLNGGSWQSASATPGTPYSVTSGGGQTVEFRVLARNVAGDSSYAQARVDMIHAPAAPKITTSEQSGELARFAYDAVVGADSYVAQYRINSGSWQNANIGPDEDLEVEASAGQTVHFRVLARNVAGDSDYATSSVTMIAPPGKPVIRSVTQSGLNARFVFNTVSGADYYVGQYQINGGSWTDINSVPDTNVTVAAAAGQTVTYRVKAGNVAGESSYSTASLKLIPAPATPKISKSEQVESNATFVFDSVPGATTYTAHYRINSGTWTSVSASPGETVNVASGAGQTVEFRVRANNVAGSSSYATASVTMVGVPATPTIVTKEQSGSNAEFGFLSVPAASSYEAAYRINSGSWQSVNVSAGTVIKIPASAGQTVEFRVRAANAAGSSAYATASVKMIAAPAAPTVSAEQVGSQARFSYTSVSGADSYVAQYRIGTGSWQTVALNPGASHSVSASPGQTVEFRVLARNVAGDSAYGTGSVTLVDVPAAPEWSLVNNSGYQVYARFNAVSGADAYEMQYNRNGEGWVNVQNPTPGVTHEFSGGSGIEYFDFRVRARNVAGWSSYNTTRLITVNAPPAPNITMKEQTSSTNVRFRFGSAARAKTYEARYRINGGSWNTISNPSANTIINVTASGGDKVEFQARAVNMAGPSSWANATVNMLSIPSTPSVSGTSLSTTRAEFTWGTDSSVASYQVQYRCAGGTWSSITTLSGSTGAYQVDCGIAETVEFRVRAVNVAGISAWGTVTVSLPKPVPGIPTVSSEAKSTTWGQFTWNDVEWADKYEYQYRCNLESWSSVFTTTSKTRNVYCDSGDTASIRVRSVNDSGTSSWRTAHVDLPAPSATPSVSINTVGTTSTNISWTAVSGSTSYEYRTLINDTGGWSDWSSNGTSRSLTLSGYTQGDKVGVQVRGVNNRGGGPHATVAINLHIAHPQVNGWIVTSSNSNTILNFQLINKYEQNICPAGTLIQTRFRDKVAGRDYWSRDWQPWVTKSASATQWSGNTHKSSTTGSTVITQEQEVRCYNPNSGNTGTVEWATFNMSHNGTPWRHR